jgi:excisionase family DNA binding protein
VTTQNTRISRDGGSTPLSVTARTASELIGVSLRTVWKLIREGKLDVARVGGRTLVKFRSLQSLVEAQDTHQ